VFYVAKEPQDSFEAGVSAHNSCSDVQSYRDVLQLCRFNTPISASCLMHLIQSVLHNAFLCYEYCVLKGIVFSTVYITLQPSRSSNSRAFTLARPRPWV